MSGNVQIPLEKFEEFLDKFSDYLDTDIKREDSDITVSLSRIPNAMDAIHSGVKELADTIKRVSLIEPKADTTTVYNQQVTNNIKQTRDNTGELQENQSDESIRSSRSDSMMIRALEEINESNSKALSESRTIESPINQLEKITELTRATVDADFEQVEAQNQLVSEQQMTNVHLSRLDARGEAQESFQQENNAKTLTALENVPSSFQDTLEATFREQNREDKQNRKKDLVREVKQNRFTRQAFSSIDGTLTAIKAKTFDPRMLMGILALKNVIGGIGSLGTGLLAAVGKIPLGGPVVKGIVSTLGRSITTVITTLLNPVQLVKFLLFAGGPIGLALRAIGVAFYALFSEEINALFSAIIDLVSDPERLSNLWSSITESVSGFVDNVTEFVTGILTKIDNLIKSIINPVIGFIGSIGPQFELMFLNMRKRIADFIRDNVPSWLGGEYVSSGIGISQDDYDREVAALEQRINEVKNADHIQNARDAVKEAIAPAVDIAMDLGGRAIDTVIDAGKQTIGRHIDAAMNLRETVSTGLMGAAEAINQVGRDEPIKAYTQQIEDKEKQEQVNLNQQLVNNSQVVNNTQQVVRPIEPSAPFYLSRQQEAL